jgi:hypothetical protein
VNDEGRRLVGPYPGPFGLFPSMPLPDVDGAITETSYAFDVVHADGVVFETNYGGDYLGDPKLEHLYTDLNRRTAGIFVCPTSPACSCSDRPHSSIHGRPLVLTAAMRLTFELARA